MDQNIELHRRHTKMFIDNDPTTITLSGVTKQSDGAGGFTSIADSPKDPITVKMIWPGGTTSGVIQNLDGQDIQCDLVLVAEFGADIQVGDFWVSEGVKYVVEGFAPRNFYEVKAGVKSYGVSPVGG